MNCTKYLIIGGGLSGYNAAKAIRQADAQGAITILANEPNRPYDRPPLTKKYMQNKVSAEETFYQSLTWYREQNISLLMERHVQSLDALSKLVQLSDGEQWSYEKALLAPGGRPVRLEVPGSDLGNVHYFRTLNDAITVSSKLAPGKKAVIIGGGFIGMELASSLTQRGLKVTVVHSAPYIWSRFADRTLATFFENYCRQRDVTFLAGQKISRIDGQESAAAVVTAGGETLPCDLVIAAIGIVPNVELAEQAGLLVDNGVLVNEQLQTSNGDIYAAGDICNYPDPFFARRRRVEHWGQADYTGTLAGQNMAGGSESYNLLTYVWSDIFDLHLEFAGDEHGFDQTIVRGDMGPGGFSVLYLKNGVLTAHFSVNLKKRQFQPLARLIESKANLAGHENQLADLNFDVTALLPAAQQVKA